jgi:hypothetical protein
MVRCCCQVIPTVGVDGEDGDKARAKMQAHFRLLGAAWLRWGGHAQRAGHHVGLQSAVLGCQGTVF